LGASQQTKLSNSTPSHNNKIAQVRIMSKDNPLNNRG
jgi:hypothetical protein